MQYTIFLFSCVVLNIATILSSHIDGGVSLINKSDASRSPPAYSEDKFLNGSVQEGNFVSDSEVPAVTGPHKSKGNANGTTLATFAKKKTTKSTKGNFVHRHAIRHSYRKHLEKDTESSFKSASSSELDAETSEEFIRRKQLETGFLKVSEAAKNGHGSKDISQRKSRKEGKNDENEARWLSILNIEKDLSAKKIRVAIESKPNLPELNESKTRRQMSENTSITPADKFALLVSPKSGRKHANSSQHASKLSDRRKSDQKRNPKYARKISSDGSDLSGNVRYSPVLPENIKDVENPTRTSLSIEQQNRDASIKNGETKKVRNLNLGAEKWKKNKNMIDPKGEDFRHNFENYSNPSGSSDLSSEPYLALDSHDSPFLRTKSVKEKTKNDRILNRTSNPLDVLADKKKKSKNTWSSNSMKSLHSKSPHVREKLRHSKHKEGKLSLKRKFQNHFNRSSPVATNSKEASRETNEFAILNSVPKHDNPTQHSRPGTIESASFPESPRQFSTSKLNSDGKNVMKADHQSSLKDYGNSSFEIPDHRKQVPNSNSGLDELGIEYAFPSSSSESISAERNFDSNVGLNTAFNEATENISDIYAVGERPKSIVSSHDQDDHSPFRGNSQRADHHHNVAPFSMLSNTNTHVNFQPRPSDSSKLEPNYNSPNRSSRMQSGSSKFKAAKHDGWPQNYFVELDGDMMLGGLMMVHEREEDLICGPVMPQGGIQALEAMLFTLDYINNPLNRVLAPNTRVGALILDDCDKDTYGLEQAVDFIKGECYASGNLKMEEVLERAVSSHKVGNANVMMRNTRGGI